MHISYSVINIEYSNSLLEKTICPLTYDAMLQASLVILQFYQAVARDLAEEHGIAYQVDLEK